MRYVYSVARFCPEPARNEAVNVGLVIGSEDSQEWQLRTVDSTRRARALGGTDLLPGVSAELTRLSTKLDAFTASVESNSVGVGTVETIDESWLEVLSSSARSTLQFTKPVPMKSNSLEDAFDALWPVLIAPSEASERRSFVTKHKALGAVSSALRQHHITSSNYLKGARLLIDGQHTGIDYAVHNGSIVHLTQCWSFQISDTESLLESVKAWAWAIRGIRIHGATVSTDGHHLDVDKNVPVAVVYVPPGEEDGEALREARIAFQDNEVAAEVVPYDQAENVAASAAQCLHVGHA